MSKLSDAVQGYIDTIADLKRQVAERESADWNKRCELESAVMVQAIAAFVEKNTPYLKGTGSVGATMAQHIIKNFGAPGMLDAYVQEQVDRAVLACAKTICQFCDEEIPYSKKGHHVGNRHCYAHAMLAANRAKVKM